MSERKPVMVAVDGTAERQQTLDWAADEAAARGDGLVICHVWEWSAVDRPLVPADLETDTGGFADATPPEVVVAVAADRARRRHPELSIRTMIGYGRVPKALIEASTGAALLVVGARGRPGLHLGSVAVKVAAHARPPVAVVHAPPHGPGGSVVVGVDGSDESAVALRFAVARARRLDRTVLAVHAYWLTPVMGVYGMNPGVDTTAVRAAAVETLERAVADVERHNPDVKIERRLVGRLADQALLEADPNADVIVVGCRGLGRFAEAVLGSVSHRVVRRAPGVVIVAR